MSISPAREINASVLPGMSVPEWATLAAAAKPELVSPREWSRLPTADKIAQENLAATNLLAGKQPGYTTALEALAGVMPEMPARQRVGIVMPAYNEHATIADTLQLLIRQSSSQGGPVDPELFGITVVVNRPVTDDAAREARDVDQLNRTIVAITNMQAAYPEIDLQYVVVEAPRDKAGVGLARMVGHDLAALRSLRRDASTRETPFYIQTMDADTPRMNPEYLSILLAAPERDGYSKDLYRQAPRLPQSDLQSHPLLHAMDFLWTDTIRSISEHSDSAWTAGAGILVSLFSHASAGGVFPFRLSRGVDEDLRIGIHARLRREPGDSSGQGQIETALFETDPRRPILVIGDLLQTLQERNMLEQRGVLTRDLHDIATLLKSYLDFHDTEIRGKNSPHYDTTAWLESSEAFEKAVPAHVVELIANSYRELMRVEISLDRAKRVFPAAANVYADFTSGQSAYSIMRGTYNKLELAVAQGALAEPDAAGSEAMQQIFSEASDTATEMMAAVLRSHGFEVEIEKADPTPPGGGPSDRLAAPIRIVSTEGYRQQLLRELAQA